MTTHIFICMIVAAALPLVLLAQAVPPGAPVTTQPTTQPTTPPTGRPAAAVPGPRAPRPVEMGADDKAAFPLPPEGFDRRRDNVPHGSVTEVEYASTTVGTRRKLRVYTPPGYAADKSYDLLVLLHGIGGDEGEWQRFCAPENILDNLLAAGDIRPMIVIFPNGRAQPNDRAEGNVFAHAPAFERFTDDLVNDVLPFVRTRYRIRQGREHLALAGFSMGGGQSLNIALGRSPETFGWVGGFSSAPNTRPPAELVPDAKKIAGLKLVYLSCGDQDGLMDISQKLHAHLKSLSVGHVWHVNPGGHSGETWKLDLYHFARLIFKAE